MSNPENPTPPRAVTGADILAEMRARFDGLERKLADAVATIEAKAATLPAVPTAYASPPAGAVADDADLDGQYGNPEVRKDPKDWSGPSCVGCRYSDCPPEFLDLLAGLLEWQAKKSAEKNELTNNGKPRADYLTRDSRRARGWAARIRARGQTGGRPQPKPRTVEAVPGYDDGADGEIPF